MIVSLLLWWSTRKTALAEESATVAAIDLELNHRAVVAAPGTRSLLLPGPASGVLLLLRKALQGHQVFEALGDGQLEAFADQGAIAMSSL